MDPLNYWKEGLANSLEEVGVKLTDEQLTRVAKDIEGAHENYGMAFYSPPAGDRIAEVEREWKEKCAKLERDAEQYRRNAETAIKQALHQHSDAVVSIGEFGEVTRWGGRPVQIQ